MKARLRCKTCGREKHIEGEPQLLGAPLGCACPEAEERAREDFASAIEDALAQLWLLAQSMDVELTLDTHSIPPAFIPPDENA